MRFVTDRRSSIRLAATVIVARSGRVGGVDVLVMRRSVASSFLGGYVVFPGGSVDPEDAERAGRWFGSAEEAARAAAVRELVEEAGLALTASGLVSAAPAEESLSVLEADPPRAGDLPEIAHWVAPEDVPVRFDARYYAIAAPGGLEPRADEHEAERVWWDSPARILERWAAGDYDLYWPTMKTMEALARCASVEELLALDIPQQEPEEGDAERMPRSTMEA
jgi:recombination protein RecT